MPKLKRFNSPKYNITFTTNKKHHTKSTTVFTQPPNNISWLFIIKIINNTLKPTTYYSNKANELKL
jgi:hypothetical protein